MKNHEVLSIVLFVLGTMFFFCGYHNIDFTSNMMRMGYDGIDISPLGMVQNMEQGYLSGIMMLFASYALFIGSFVNSLRITKH